jgi:uncharacterized membrane protein YgaE (UPF0421/DUF939 family)
MFNKLHIAAPSPEEIRAQVLKQLASISDSVLLKVRDEAVKHSKKTMIPLIEAEIKKRGLS